MPAERSSAIHLDHLPELASEPLRAFAVVVINERGTQTLDGAASRDPPHISMQHQHILLALFMLIRAAWAEVASGHPRNAPACAACFDLERAPTPGSKRHQARRSWLNRGDIAGNATRHFAEAAIDMVYPVIRRGFPASSMACASPPCHERNYHDTIVDTEECAQHCSGHAVAPSGNLEPVVWG